MILELFFLVVVIFLCVKWHQDEWRGMPPGPWDIPLIGHLFILGNTPYLTLMDWKKKYGPLISCRFGSFRTVVICDGKLIKQAFSMSEFSGRAQIQAFVEAANNKGILFSEGPHNTEQRQFALVNLKNFGMGKKEIDTEIHEGLNDFLEKIEENNGKPMKNTRISHAHVLTTVWRIMMTEKIAPESAEHMAYIIQEKVNQMGSTLCQMAFFMPWLENLTRLITFGQKSLIKVRIEGFRELYAFCQKHILRRKSTWIQEQPRDITDVYLDKIEEIAKKDTQESGFHPKQATLPYFSGDLFQASIETTSTVIEWLLYYMALYPEVQRKLQKEVDTVLGERLVSLSDRPVLPFTDATMYEILRISTFLPLAVPHQTLKEVNFHGYRIPKGTMIVPNVYGVHFDPETWGDPDNYRPERWMGEDSKNLKQYHFLPFSSGKRSCIGEVMARDTLFIYIATLFQRYTVTFPGDKTPDVTAIIGIGRGPSDFEVLFTPRTQDQATK